jgi:EmrB/QacA subfamily drug resistance transporter
MEQHIRQTTKVISPSVKKYLPLLTALAIFMQSLDGTILNTALPSIATDLNRSPIAMQSVIVSYLLTLVLLIPVSGWLADKFGTRKVFGVAIIVFTLGSLCCALSINLIQLVLSRILQAIGGSMMVPVARLALLYTYPKRLLLKVLNFAIVPGMIGPIIGPSLGGWIVEIASWHWIFLINIPIGCIAVWMASFAIPDYKSSVGKFDFKGYLLFGAAITIGTLVLEMGIDNTVRFSVMASLVLATVTFAVLYIRHANLVDKPLINLSLFKIRTLKIGLIGNLVTRLGIGGIPLFLPLMLQVGLGYPASVAGAMLMPMAIANVATKPFIVRIVKRMGYKNVLITNTIALGVMIGIISLITANTPKVHIIMLLVVFGTVSSIQFTTMNTISIADLENETSSEGNSLIAVTQQLSISFGISVGSFILQLMSNWTYLQQKGTVFPFKGTFLVLGIMTVLSSIVFTQLRPGDGSKLSGNRRVG